MWLAYEYGYNSDGARVWKRDVLNGQEYRYVCRIGCGGVPMRLYNRPMSGGSWASVEDYLEAGRLLAYGSKIRIDLEDPEIYYQEELSFVNVPVDTSGHRMLRAVPCIAVPLSFSNLDFCTSDNDECIDIPDDSAILTRLGQRPCPPVPDVDTCTLDWNAVLFKTSPYQECVVVHGLVGLKCSTSWDGQKCGAVLAFATETGASHSSAVSSGKRTALHTTLAMVRGGEESVSLRRLRDRLAFFLLRQPTHEPPHTRPLYPTRLHLAQPVITTRQPTTTQQPRKTALHQPTTLQHHKTLPRTKHTVQRHTKLPQQPLQ